MPPLPTWHRESANRFPPQVVRRSPGPRTAVLGSCAAKGEKTRSGAAAASAESTTMPILQRPEESRGPVLKIQRPVDQHPSCTLGSVESPAKSQAPASTSNHGTTT